MKKYNSDTLNNRLSALSHRLGRSGRFLFLGIATAIHSGGIQAHEFWLSPDTFSPVAGQEIELIAYIGEGLEGAVTTLHPVESAVPANQLHHDPATTTAEITSTGAISAQFNTPGLQVFSYEPDIALHRYSSFLEFENFANAEGLNDAVAIHKNRQLPTEYFTEIVKRFNKTYFCVADSIGIRHDDNQQQRWGAQINDMNFENRPVSPITFGTDIELTAIARDRLNGTGKHYRYQLQLDRHSRPLRGYPITVFQKNAAGQVSNWQQHTDASGQISFDTQADSQYLVNSVVLDSPSPEDIVKYGAVWQSDWASLLLDTSSDCTAYSQMSDFPATMVSQPG